MAYGSSTESTVVGIATTEYAQRTRHLIKLISELRGVGAQAHIDLPRIAVIGNQSAGKSSLVEAISGITVPRAIGTCTRCPMECRLQNSSGLWRCQVSLRFERDENGQRIDNVHEVKFGPLITDKSELEEMIRRGQLAILNPSVKSTAFEDFDTRTVVPGHPPIGNTKPLQFSSNVVALDIHGPELADLSFIDLPGIISNVSPGEDRNSIALIRALVKEHIRGNALILLTLTMRDDLDNQSAADLAKEVDPEGIRTIGVLTKADTIYPGEEPTWLEVLEGKRYPLKHGYYVTKQPGPEELKEKPSFGDARRQEEIFFSNQDPWRSSSNQIKSRTGIPSLTAELSKLLSQLIMRTLPKLREDARNIHDAIGKELAELPPPLPDNPLAELLRLLTVFSAATNKWINGIEQHEGLIQSYRAASEKFKLDILRTAPDLRPFETAAQEEASVVEFDNQVEDDPTILPSDEAVDWPVMYLEDVRDYVKQSLSRQLPYNVPFSAKRGLIEKSFSSWERHALAYFEIVYQATSKQLNELIEDHFRRFIMSPLRDNVKSIVEKHLTRFRKETTDRIAWFLELESPPFTQNTHYYSSLRQKYLSKYSAVRNAKRISFTSGSALTALAALANLGIEGLTAKDLHKLTPADFYEEELVVMAEVNAYFRVAYKRIIDDLPRIVDHDFLGSLGRHLQTALVEEFGLGSETAAERAKLYLTEDPSDAARRDVLLAKMISLDEVQKKLFNFGL